MLAGGRPLESARGRSEWADVLDFLLGDNLDGPFDLAVLAR